VACGIKHQAQHTGINFRLAIIFWGTEKNNRLDVRLHVIIASDLFVSHQCRIWDLGTRNAKREKKKQKPE
jgi:hypothetical protein